MKTLGSIMPLWVWIVIVCAICASITYGLLLHLRKKKTVGARTDDSVKSTDNQAKDIMGYGLDNEGSEAEKDAARRLKQHRKKQTTLGGVTVVLSLCVFCIFMLYRYIVISSKPSKEIVDKTSPFFDLGVKDRTYYDFINTKAKQIGWINPDLLVDAAKAARKNGSSESFATIQTYTNKPKFLGFKRQELGPLAQSLVIDYNEIYQESLETRKTLNQYQYVPKRLSDIIGDGSDIQQPLITIEAIKLTTGLQFYLQLPDFIDETQRLLSIPQKNVLVKYFGLLIEDAEDLTTRYIELCTLNPYENSDCARFGDFDTYVALKYKDIYTSAEINKFLQIFKEVVPRIARKLDNALYPVLSITVNSYDPASQTISFAVEIATYEDMYTQLATLHPTTQPHMVIVSSLVDLLRLSKLIRGDGIEINELKSDRTTQVINGDEQIVIRSKYTFDVPLQKQTEREIFDTDTIFIYSS